MLVYCHPINLYTLIALGILAFVLVKSHAIANIKVKALRTFTIKLAGMITQKSSLEKSIPFNLYVVYFGSALTLLFFRGASIELYSKIDRFLDTETAGTSIYIKVTQAFFMLPPMVFWIITPFIFASTFTPLKRIINSLREEISCVYDEFLKS